MHQVQKTKEYLSAVAPLFRVVELGPRHPFAPGHGLEQGLVHRVVCVLGHGSDHTDDVCTYFFDKQGNKANRFRTLLLRPVMGPEDKGCYNVAC